MLGELRVLYISGYSPDLLADVPLPMATVEFDQVRDDLRFADRGDLDLSERITDRGFDFGAKEDVAAITIVYPIDFLPAG